MSSTDRQIDLYSTLQAACTDRAFSIISPAIGYSYWPVTPLDATRVDGTIILVPFRALKQQIVLPPLAPPLDCQTSVRLVLGRLRRSRAAALVANVTTDVLVAFGMEYVCA